MGRKQEDQKQKRLLHMSVHQKKGREEPTATLQYCKKLLQTTKDIF